MCNYNDNNISRPKTVSFFKLYDCNEATSSENNIKTFYLNIIKRRNYN